MKKLFIIIAIILVLSLVCTLLVSLDNKGTIELPEEVRTVCMVGDFIGEIAEVAIDVLIINQIFTIIFG